MIMKKKKTVSEHPPDFNEFIPSSLPLSVQQVLQMAIKKLQAGSLLPAEELCLQILQKESDNADANHLLGIIASRRGKKDLAIELLSKAIQANPNNAEIHKNLGQILNSTGRLDEATDSFRNAISLNPNYAEAYNVLGVTLKNMGRLDEAIENFRKAILINPGFAEVHNNLGNAFLDSDREDEAIDSFKAAINAKPDFAMAYYNLGTAYHKTNRIGDAIACYKKSLSLNPRNARAYNTLGIISQNAGRMEEAITNFEKALSLDPDFAGAYNNLGLMYKELGKINEATVNFRKAISLDPDYAEAYLNFGIVHKESGLMDDAIACYEKALSLKPDLIGALKNLAVSVKYTEMCDFIYRLKDMFMEKDLSDDDRMHLGFALGKVYEDIKDYDKAFEVILHAARLKRQTYEYSIQDNKDKFDEIKMVFTPEFFSSYSNVGNPDQTPIFILGMPRSGTTLIEQILASHPQVFGAGELQILFNLTKEFCSGETIKSYPKCISGFTADMFMKIGSDYIDTIRKHSKDTDYITDKMPHNFLYVGLIKIILPKAKVIHCTRNPMDNCLSIFKTEFRAPYKYSYDMVELGHYYNLYLDLMKHWEDILPGFMYNLRYEDLVADQEKQTRGLLDFCGLDWNESCLAFHKTQRIVKTASFAQVRQPMYKDSVELWKRYEAQLEPLRKIVLGE